MAPPNSRDTLIDYCKRRLGDPVLEINVDENPNSPSKLGVRGIPALFIFKNGEMVSSKIGAAPKTDLKNWIDEST